MVHKDVKSSWGPAVSVEKREIFEERAQTVLHLIKHKFPGIPQSSLEISKIQCNKVWKKSSPLSLIFLYSRIQTCLLTLYVMC